MKNSDAYVIRRPMQLGDVDDFIRVASHGHRTVAPSVDARILAVARFTLAIICSAILGWSSASIVGMGFDAGYQLVTNAYGHTQAQQGVIAAMALWFAVLPLSCSFIFGWCKTTMKGSIIWNTVPAIGVTGLASIAFLADLDAQSVMEFAPWITFALIFAYCAHFAGQKLARRSEDKAHFLLISMCAFLPAGYCVYTGMTIEPMIELVVFCGSLMVAAFVCVKHADTLLLTSALRISTVVLIPVLIPLVFNVAANILSLYFDLFGLGANLGWRALASAQMLLIATALAIGAASIAACKSNATEVRSWNK